MKLDMVRYKVEGVRFTTPSVMVLDLHAIDVTNSLLFLPGQYAGIEFKHRGRPTSVRCFSIASDPSRPEVVQFGIRVGGRWTSTFSKIKPGEIVTLHGPYGGFVTDSDKEQSLVFLAGGIGITPFLSMIRHATSVKAEVAIKLLYSVRSQKDISFKAEINQLASDNPLLEVIYLVSDGPVSKLGGAQVKSGRLEADDILPPAGKDIKDTTFYICGPPAYMKAAVATIQSLGVDKERIVTEAFSQGTGGGTRAPHGWQLNLYALSTLGFTAAALAFLTQDVVKTLPGILLPEHASATAGSRAATARDQDLDNLIQRYSEQTSGEDSPALKDARKLASDAEAKAAEVNAKNAAMKNNTTYVAPSPRSNSTNSPSPRQTPPAPITVTPTPTKTCTTSPSGVTTCV